MELDGIDAQVLDLIADDYYGLWEIADYFAQLFPEMGRTASDELIRSRLRQYVQAGFATLFVGHFATGKNIQKPADELAVLDDPVSWQRPNAIAEGVAATATPKAEPPVAKVWPKNSN